MAALDAPAARAAEMIARTFAVVRIATSAKHDRSAEALLGQTLKNQIAFRAWWSGFGTSSGAHGNSMQRQELTVRGAQGAAKELVELSVPFNSNIVGCRTGCRAIPATTSCRLYARMAESIRDGKPASPSFAAAVTRHRLLDAIMRASETGRKQVL